MQTNSQNIGDTGRLSVVIPIERIRQEVNKLIKGNWVDHVNRRDYTGAWDVLPLRTLQTAVDSHPIIQAFSIEKGLAWEDLPVIGFCPGIRHTLDQLQCQLRAVRLMRLKAGSTIKPHRDKGLGIQFGEARLHLPIHTNDRVRFLCNGQVIPMRAGELWYVNTDKEHAVDNLGDDDRINLVIDCEVNIWLIDKLGRRGYFA